MIAMLLTFLLNQLLCLPIFKPLFLFIFAVLALFAGFAELSIGEEYDNGFLCGAGKINLGVAILTVIVILGGGIFGSALFNSSAYHNAITVDKHDETEIKGNIPELANIDQVSLMDTASAEKLGDRTLGTLTDLVSQYKVGNYYTICINGAVKKIAPLEYNGFFKWSNNRQIPGYVIVDPLTSTAEYVELDRVIKYAPSAYFGEDLARHVRNGFSSEYFGDYSFQVDDDGNPYWIITLEKPNNIWSNKVPYAAVIVDACNGEMTKYMIDKLPEWVDIVIGGKTVSNLYNRYGRYVNGFWNFSETGVTQVTDDYGYITMNDDVYIYTGITSVSSDESNLGFILVNSRTGKFDYYPIAGAEEYSAMGAAEGLVQNYGYTASFPSLILVNDEPTYVMVLKDNNGLVKKYAMVNYKNYTVAAEADTIDKCVIAYDRAFNGESYNDTSVTTNPVNTNVEVPDGYAVITRIVFMTTNNASYTYINSSDGKAYKAPFNESHIKLIEGSVFNPKDFTEIK